MASCAKPTLLMCPSQTNTDWRRAATISWAVFGIDTQELISYTLAHKKRILIYWTAFEEKRSVVCCGDKAYKSDICIIKRQENICR